MNRRVCRLRDTFLRVSRDALQDGLRTHFWDATGVRLTIVESGIRRFAG
jgi:hypothetical protein